MFWKMVCSRNDKGLIMRVKRSNFLVIFTSGADTSGNKKNFNTFTSTIINTGNQILFALYLFNARTFFLSRQVVDPSSLRVTHEPCIGRLF